MMRRSGGRRVACSTWQRKALRVFGAVVCLQATAHADDAPKVSTGSQKHDGKRVDLSSGASIVYGVSLTALRIRSQRADTGGVPRRDYQVRADVVPGELGFQVLYAPAARPYRLGTASGDNGFQLMSAGGTVLVDFDAEEPDQCSVGIAGNLAFFDDTLILGAGLDFYRGIPVTGADGATQGTAYTGLMGWAVASEGEVTPENFFFTVGISLIGIVDRISGSTKAP
jgi:hypothetical protein